MFSNLYFIFLTLVFGVLYVLRYIGFFYHSQVMIGLIPDLIHFTLGGLAAGLAWALSDKDRRFYSPLLVGTIFLSIWFYFTRVLHPHSESPVGTWFLFLNVLTGPLWLTSLRFIPQTWNWFFYPLAGFFYWTWLAQLYRFLIFQRWKGGKAKTLEEERHPSKARIAYYRLAFAVGLLTSVAALVVHICLYRIPFLPAPPFPWLEGSGMGLFIGLWITFFIKQEKDKQFWKNIKLPKKGFLDGFYRVFRFYSVACFILVFGGLLILTVTGRIGKPPHAPPGGGWTPESLQGRFFMIGWTAFLMFIAFSSARETFFQIRYLEGRSDPNDLEDDPAESTVPGPKTLEVPHLDPEAALMTDSPLERKGDIPISVLPSLKQKAPIILIGVTLFLLGVPSLLYLIATQTQGFGKPWIYLAIEGCAVLYLLANVLPIAVYIYFFDPIAILAHRGLWMCELGWIAWDEIREMRVVMMGNTRTILIVPKDWAWVGRVKWHFWLKARFNRLFRGYLTTYPMKDFTVSGNDLLEYARRRGVKTTQLDGWDSSSIKAS